MKISTIKSSIFSVLNNLSRLLSFAWKTDKGLVLGYYGTAGLGAFFPIIASFIFKLFIDSLVSSLGAKPTIPLVLIAILASRYFVNIVWDFVMWGMKNIYFDFLLRYKLQNALNYTFYKKVSHLDIAHLENAQTQDLIGKAADTFAWRPPDFLRQFNYMFNNFVAFVSSFFIVMPYGWWIPLIITTLTLPRLFLRARFGKLQWSIYGSGAPEVRKLWYYRRILSDRVPVIESRIFQSHTVLLKRFKKIQDYLYDLNKKPVKNFLKIIAFPRILEMSVTFVFAYFKLPDVLSGAMSIGDFTFFISLIDRISDSAGDMILNFGEMYENNLYVDHYFEVLNLPKLIQEPAKTRKVPIKPMPPKIEFKKVNFCYPGSHTKVLKNISFSIEPKENIAIVGPNGAGKTTIVKLLCRFYDVDSGDILVNGVNIKELKLSEWYDYLGTLFQEFVHYNFTVKENIVLGNPEIDDKARMKDAAEKSGAAEFIEKLPRKYNQLLGRQFEGGVELSQGQWQRLAIARAFYEGASILILDEPTSAIDAEAEYEIFLNLHKFYKDKSLFLISHRFSTVRNADKIIVLDKGEIVEQGSHDELLKNQGLYARMFSKQALGYR